MKDYLRLTRLAFFLMVTPFLGPHPATGQVDPWEFEVYPYKTVGRGVIEIETDNAIVAKGHKEAGSGLASGTFPSYGMWFNQYEFTYGLTDRIEAAAYLNLAKPNAHGLTYAGSKFRLRGRLFDEEVLPIDLGWYLEIEYQKTPQFDDQKLEFEMRIPMQKDIGPLSVMFNPIFEKPVIGSEKHLGFEFGYSAGLYYRWLRALSPGLEFYGGVGNINNPEPTKEQQHYIFPVLKGELPLGLEYNFGVGVGLTRGSDPVVVKFNVELEHFIGAIFGPSSENSWFW
jgi:hypothetical protein